MTKIRPQTRPPPKVTFSKLVPGMKVTKDGKTYFVTDQTKSNFTAWDNWEYGRRLLIQEGTGESLWVEEEQMPDLYPVLPLNQE